MSDNDLHVVDLDFTFESDEDAKELNIFSTSNNGFLRFYETGLFCDLLLQMPDGVQYKVHQAIVAYTSPYLADLLPAAQVLVCSSIPLYLTF